MKNRVFAAFATIATILLALIVPAQSAGYFFYDVADSSNIPPFFSGFSDFPAINNTGTVAFRASEDFSVFANFTAPVTGGGPYVNVGAPDFTLIVPFDPLINDSGTVAFYAWVQAFSGATIHAILTAPASGTGPVVHIVDNEAGPYSDFSFPTLNNSNLLGFLAGLTAGGSGLFTAPSGGGTVTTVTDSSGSFSRFGPPWLSSTGVFAFRGVLDSGPTGIFVIPASGGAPAMTVADTTSQFTAFGFFPVINGAGTVVFQGTEVNGLTGIFKGSGGGSGPINTIADSSGSYSDFINSNSFLYGPREEFAINENGTVVFYANLTSGGFGLFNGPDPVTNRVIGSGDALFGSAVTNLALSNGGLNNAGQVAFYFELADGRSGVAVATAGTPPPPPQVSLHVSPANVNKTGTAVFTAIASTPPLAPLVVPFAMSGDAEQDTDYELDTFFNQIIIPAGHTTGSVTLTVITTKTTGKETAIMTLQPGDGYTLSKIPAGIFAAQASVKINNKKAN